MADLGFDFTDEQHDYTVNDAPFSQKTQTVDAPSETTTALASSSNGIGHPTAHRHTPQTDEPPAKEHQDTDANESDTQDTIEEGLDTDTLLQNMEEAEAIAEDDEDELVIKEDMSPTERILALNKSDVMIQRLLVVKELSSTLQKISVSEAVHAILPVVLKLGSDPDDTVRETLASELDKIIMYYYRNAAPQLGSPASSSAVLLQPDSPSLSDQNTQGQQLTAADQDAAAQVTQHTKDNTATVEKQINQEQETASVATAPASPGQPSPAPHTAPLSPPTNAKNGIQSSPHLHDTNNVNMLHIPQLTFAPLLIEFLLDQNSTLASLGQQCIVSVASELVSAEGTTDEPLYTQLLETEIFEGVVMGLMAIVDGRRQRSANPEEDDDAGKSHPDRDDTSHFGTHSGSDDVNQGEINLAKMMCLSLISALANALGPQRCTERCLPIVERMANDQMFYVRKEAAAAVGSLATAVGTQVALDRLLPMYLTFSRDTIWHVRRSCVLALPLLCGVLPEDVKTHIAVEGVKLFRNDASRNVRNTLSEVIGELIARFLPEGWEVTNKPGKVPEPLLEFFLSLGPSSNNNQMYKLDTDRTIICAYNFPAVVLTAGAAYWDSHLKDTYLSLTKDYQIKVRRTFAYSLHEIARIIGPERTERDLVQIFALYLMDLDDVKQGVLEHLTEFLGTLAVSSRNEYIPILAEVWDGVMTNWRLRDILAAQLRDIALLFDATRVVEHILPLAIRACQDEYAAVRETGVETFPVILEMVKHAVDADGETLSQTEDDEVDSVESRRNYALALLNHVMERLDEFARSDAYRNRLIFVQICRSLLDIGICASDFAPFFLARLAPLADDPVVNVRIATSRTIRVIVTNESYRQDLNELVLPELAGEHEAQPGQILEQTLYLLAMDRDSDVRSFVIDLVDPKRLAERQEEYRLLMKQQEEDGSPMQDVEDHHDTKSEASNNSPDVSAHTRHDPAPAVEHKALDTSPTDEDKAVQNEVDILTTGALMDFSIEQASEADKDTTEEDETMMDAEDEKASVSNSQESLSKSPHQTTDDKEQEEYVYLSASMGRQESSSSSLHVTEGTQ